MSNFFEINLKIIKLQKKFLKVYIYNIKKIKFMCLKIYIAIPRPGPRFCQPFPRNVQFV